MTCPAPSQLNGGPINERLDLSAIVLSDRHPIRSFLDDVVEIESVGARDGFAFDLGNLGFANIWLAMGSFAVCCGWVVLSTRILGRWLGWWAIVAGVGLILVRFAWSGEIWFAPYALFWLWVIIVCIQLIRLKIALPEEVAA
jgi:hypothetical protein